MTWYKLFCFNAIFQSIFVQMSILLFNPKNLHKKCLPYILKCLQLLQMWVRVNEKHKNVNNKSHFTTLCYHPVIWLDGKTCSFTKSFSDFWVLYCWGGSPSRHWRNRKPTQRKYGLTLKEPVPLLRESVLDVTWTTTATSLA